ncbi:MAG TPA: glycosyltransferase family 2 protein [Solirubrobacteraceae bacterium]|nr:glycosyltransferase family 2 protein [Solirubrobacteraceae bacterium]
MTGRETSPLGVAVVSFNTREILQRCLASVVAARPCEAVVVDNGSTDGSVELVRHTFPSVRLIVNECNVGYGAAANQALVSAAASAVLLLNSDTVLAPTALSALEAYLSAHPRAAVVGPRLANVDGSLQRSTYPFPSAGDALLGESGLHLLVRRVPVLRERLLRTWSHDVARPVPWVLGAALAIRREPFEAVGGFDEAFFMYGEEVDLCRRLREAGFETHFAPVTTVLHLGGASTAIAGRDVRREFLVSERRYMLRHESRRAARRLLAVMHAIVRARLARERLRRWIAGGRPDLDRAIAGWEALLAERGLWRP